jgi:hypothetical protein
LGQEIGKWENGGIEIEKYVEISTPNPKPQTLIPLLKLLT